MAIFWVFPLQTIFKFLLTSYFITNINKKLENKTNAHFIHVKPLKHITRIIWLNFSMEQYVSIPLSRRCHSGFILELSHISFSSHHWPVFSIVICII